MMRRALLAVSALFACGATTHVARAASAPIVFVPLDDRPVTLQLPHLLGEIAGVRVVTPPAALLGSYLRFGTPDAIVAWLNAPSQRSDVYVISSDMLAYGGLVASRVPGPTYADAYFRLRELDVLHRDHPQAWLRAFGTIVRLAPTGVPALGGASGFFAAGQAWMDLQRYANLHDPPLATENTTEADLRARLGPTLDAYLAVRARNLGVDRHLLEIAQSGTLDRLVIGQDDAGAVGLHVREVSQLQQIVRDDDLSARASIEPGADELGMALLARAFARQLHWTPRIAVIYSTPDGAVYHDPLEFAPVSETIDRLITLCGGVHDDADPDIALYVRVPHTTPADNDAFIERLRAHADNAVPVAFADLSFEESYATQGAYADRLLDAGIASRLDAYAAWNTAANTVGTALAESIAAGAGRRAHRYNALAHRTFTFMRFVDDDAFHVTVRPNLNSWLDSIGIHDHTYLEPSVAIAAEERNRALVWNSADALLPRLYPDLHIAAMHITLPWQRTFETEIDVRLAPNFP